MIGSKLMGVLCKGASEPTAAWQGIDAVEVPNFWANYTSDGRCTIDVGHGIEFLNDESRWLVTADSRSCQWSAKQLKHLNAGPKASHAKSGLTRKGNSMREKFAYSVIGLALARMLQSTPLPDARAHWIQDAFAGHKTWASLK